MRFSLNFIKDFLKIETSPQKLSSLLTMAGMEVEEFGKVGADWVFDIEVTSNRYDWLSHLGIAREIAAGLNKKLKVKYPKVIKKPPLRGRRIIIESLADCPFYSGRAIERVTVARPPLWLKERILNCGINSVNNLVDITNYIMLKWGNPLHLFDHDKIEGGLHIRRARKGEAFIGIDEKERVLSRENLVIADEKKVIALAGVIGAKNTEVGSETKNVFLEAAIFSPLAVRRSRRAAGLDTESSYRFERSVSPSYLEYASLEASRLIEDLGKGNFAGYSEAGRNPQLKRKKIAVEIKSLNAYLGVNLSQKRTKKIFENFGFKINRSAKGKILVSPPLFRFDLEKEVDAYEEVARAYGYEKINPKMFPFPPRDKEETRYRLKDKLRQLLSALGLKEIITYSIEGEGDLNKLTEKGRVKILNPLRKQEDTLRPTLLLGMIKSVRYNLNRKQANLSFFEIANIYERNRTGFSEQELLSLAVTGKNEDFFYLKRIVEEVFGCFNIINFRFKEGKRKGFANALSITVASKEIGFLGKLDGALKKEFALREDLFFSQLKIESLSELMRDKTYKRFSPYPVTYRDISMAVHKDLRFKNVREIVQSKAEFCLSDLRIVDFYKGKDIPATHSAFTLRIFYQAKDRTLTSEEVDAIHNKLRECFGSEKGIILR